jgi:hypothetical protein
MTSKKRRAGSGKGEDEGQRLGSLWPRYSDYIVTKTPLLVIRPKADATLDLYDPWKADRDAPSEEERPYKQLLRLAQRVREKGGARLKMAQRERQQLESWVRKNGLLGILPHETLTFTNIAHWHESPIEREFDESKRRGLRRLTPYQLEPHRLANEWMVAYHRAGDDYPLRSAPPGGVVAEELLDDRARPATVTFRRWPEGELKTQRLGRRFVTFFAGGSSFAVEQREYSSPRTTAFWRGYGEPVGMLLHYAWHLANCISAFAVWPPVEDWQQRNAALALIDLNDAASQSSLVGHFGEDWTMTLDWSGVSLLACYAALILQDLAGGQRALRCPVCGGVFLSSAHQARFCSSTCRYTFHKREQRQREKDAEEQP